MDSKILMQNRKKGDRTRVVELMIPHLRDVVLYINEAKVCDSEGISLLKDEAFHVL